MDRGHIGRENVREADGLAVRPVTEGRNDLAGHISETSAKGDAVLDLARLVSAGDEKRVQLAGREREAGPSSSP